jgi:hypothetical protein
LVDRNLIAREAKRKPFKTRILRTGKATRP